MFTSLDAGTNRFLSSLRTLNQGIERATREVTSGKRVLNPSDDPDVLSALMETRSQIARLDQIQSNLARLNTEVNAAEGSMQSAVKLFDRVRVLAASAASGTQTAETRRTIAGEVEALLERFAGLGNTEADGRFLFSGDSDQSAAFHLDLGNNPPWSTYQGATATRRALHPNGTTFAIAKSADEIFNNADPAKNVFQTVENLRQALLANDDAAVNASLENMPKVSEHLNAMLSFYGNAQTMLADSADSASKLKLQFNSQLSSIEDADITESIVRMQELRFQQQAALQIKGNSPRTSLFDYLG